MFTMYSAVSTLLRLIAQKTNAFNGYEPQVGQLYAGMDLKKFY